MHFTMHLLAPKVLYLLSAMLEMVLVHVISLDLDPGGVERFDNVTPMYMQVHWAALGGKHHPI